MMQIAIQCRQAAQGPAIAADPPIGPQAYAPHGALTEFSDLLAALCMGVVERPCTGDPANHADSVADTVNPDIQTADQPEDDSSATCHSVQIQLVPNVALLPADIFLRAATPSVSEGSVATTLVYANSWNAAVPHCETAGLDTVKQDGSTDMPLLPDVPDLAGSAPLPFASRPGPPLMLKAIALATDSPDASALDGKPGDMHRTFDAAHQKGALIADELPLTQFNVNHPRVPERGEAIRTVLPSLSGDSDCVTSILPASTQSTVFSQAEPLTPDGVELEIPDTPLIWRTPVKMPLTSAPQAVDASLPGMFPVSPDLADQEPPTAAHHIVPKSGIAEFLSAFIGPEFTGPDPDFSVDGQHQGAATLGTSDVTGLAVSDATPARHMVRPQTPLLAQHLSHQLAVQVRQRQDGATDVDLDPIELGRVRMTVTATDQTLTLVLMAERPETTDLMRRHGDLLQQEFRNLGFTTVNLSFAGSQDGAGSGSASGAGPGDIPIGTDSGGDADIAVTAAPVAMPTADGSLDLRL